MNTRTQHISANAASVSGKMCSLLPLGLDGTCAYPFVSNHSGDWQLLSEPVTGRRPSNSKFRSNSECQSDIRQKNPKSVLANGVLAGLSINAGLIVNAGVELENTT